MCFPVRTELPNNARHDEVRNCHGQGTKNGNSSTTHLVHVQQNWDAADKLADVDDPREDQRHLVLLSQFREEGRGIINEGIDTRELRKQISTSHVSSSRVSLTCWKNGIAIATKVLLRYRGRNKSSHCLTSIMIGPVSGCCLCRICFWKRSSLRIPLHSSWTFSSDDGSCRRRDKEFKLSWSRFARASHRGEKGKK